MTVHKLGERSIGIIKKFITNNYDGSKSYFTAVRGVVVTTGKLKSVNDKMCYTRTIHMIFSYFHCYCVTSYQSQFTVSLIFVKTRKNNNFMETVFYQSGILSQFFTGFLNVFDLVIWLSGA